ncbi:MAG: ABC transporter ATP-binding protein [Anaerolineaceae bacterium]|nr:ABC transporter ATP-binding protein [Anaerolineaceae bacterium]
MNAAPAIETHALTKVYGVKTAVDRLDLRVEQGEVFGFLGPNGAGKTTTIKMLLNLVTPTGGEAHLFGLPPTDTSSRTRVGFLPEHFRFHDWLTAVEFLQLHGELCRLSREVIRERIPLLLERVGLAEFAGHPLRTFSKGMLQRVGLAQALINDPLLVILDEPTSGLDPVGRRLVRDLIHELRQEGKSVFLNSHLLSEVEITCDRVAFVKHGHVLETRSLQGLQAGELRVVVRTSGLPPTLDGMERFGRLVQREGDTLTLAVKDEEQLPRLNRFLVSKGVDVYALTPQRSSLEEQFLQIIGTDGGL